MKKILIFGSGKVSFSLVDFLYKRLYALTVASNNLEEAKTLLSQYPKNTQAIEIDVKNREACIKLIKAHDIVVSLVNPPLHPFIVEYCLECSKDLACSSYLPQNYEKYD